MNAFSTETSTASHDLLMKKPPGHSETVPE